MPILSIIVPVYNSEKFLENTVHSILQQTFKDFELILVNDGSSDNSLSIANKLADADSRIVVLNKINGGVCSARNMGLNYSTGKYVGFVDNDDLIEPDMYEVLINDLETYSADVACVRFALLDKGKREGQKELGCDFLLINKFEAIDALCSSGIVSFACWDKLYLGEIARKTFFNENLIYTEDYNWVLDYLLQIEKIVLRDEVKYIYIQYVDSAIHKKMDLGKCLNYIGGLYLAYEKCLKNKLPQFTINKAYELYYGKIISLMRQSLIESEKEIFLKLQQKLKLAVEEMPKDSISKFNLFRRKRFFLPYGLLRIFKGGRGTGK